jgi:hypothetical protein
LVQRDILAGWSEHPRASYHRAHRRPRRAPMRPVSFGPLAPKRQHRPEARLDHPVAARVRLLREIENASDEDAIAVADS